MVDSSRIKFRYEKGKPADASLRWRVLNEGYALQVGNIFLKLVELTEEELLQFHNFIPLKPITGGAVAVHIRKDHDHILGRNMEFRQVTACTETVRN